MYQIFSLLCFICIDNYKQEVTENRMKIPTGSNIPFKTIGTLMVPSFAVGGLFYNAEKTETERHQASYIGNNLAATICSVVFPKISKWTLPVLGPAMIFMNSLKKKTKYEKASSVIKDSAWLGCGIAAQKILMKTLFKGLTSASNPLKMFSLLAELGSFAVGSQVFAPAVSRFLMKNFVDPVLPKPEQEEIMKLQIPQPSPLPVFMDRLNVSRLTMPNSSKQENKGH